MPFSPTTLSPMLRDALTENKRMGKTKARSDDPFFKEIIEIVNHVLTGRNWDLKIYHDFYEGGDAQKAYFVKFEDEDQKEYARRLDQSVVVNKAKGIVLKSARALYAIHPPERRMEDQVTHERMMPVWEFNRMSTGLLGVNLAIDVCRYGFTVVQNVYVDKKTKTPIFHKPGPGEDAEVLYHPQQPPLVIPLPRKGRETDMGAIIRMSYDDPDSLSGYGNSDRASLKWLEFIDDTRWFLWKVDIKTRTFGGDVVVGTRVPVNFGPEFVDVNPYGNINIPFTLFRNSGETEHSIWGDSDLADVIGPQTKYNETLSDDGHVIAQNTFPILFGKGLTFPSNWKRGPGDTIDTNNTEADVKYVTWETDLDASSNFEDRLERQMRETAGFSPVIDGDLRSIGQVRNLRGAMMPELLTINHKQIVFTDAEQRLAEATLFLIEWHESASYPDKKLDITFSDDFIPVDDLTKAETLAIELNSGVENLRDEIKKRNPELETDAEIDAKLAETLELIATVTEARGKLGNPGERRGAKSESDDEKTAEGE